MLIAGIFYPFSLIHAEELALQSASVEYNYQDMTTNRLLLRSALLESDYQDMTTNRLLVRSMLIEYDYAVVFDTIPPVSEIQISKPKYQTLDKTFVSSKTSFTITAIDPIVKEVTSGVSSTEYRINQLLWQIYTKPFSITGADGSCLIEYHSIDNVNNTESVKSIEVILDNTPLLTIITIGKPQYSTEISTWITSGTEIGLAATDGEGSGLANVQYRIDVSSWLIYTSTFTISQEGEHTISYRSQDNLGNLEETKSFTVVVDNTAPTSSTQIGLPKFNEYVTSATSFTLTALDGGIIPCGVKETRYQINQSTWSAYQEPFFLTGADGIYEISYYSFDHLDNTEEPKSLTVKLDNTPPVSRLEVKGMKYECKGKTYIRPDTQIFLSGEDSPISGVASGLKEIKYAIDSFDFATYTEPFTLNKGTHTIYYQSLDNLGNVETVKSFLVWVDNTPPETSLVIGEPKCSEHPYPVISSLAPLTLLANDPVAQNVASGVKETRYRIQDTEYQIYQGTFNLTGQDGDYLLSYYSLDNVENQELVKSATVTLDNTPPTLQILSPSRENYGLCKIVNGTTTIFGSVSDLHFRYYELDYQVRGSTVWVSIQSKTFSQVQEGVLAAWDTTGLSENWYKIRLTAKDCVGNEATDEVEVYVGRPELKLSFGRIGNASGEFNSPSYIVRDSSGNTWISDTNNDRIQKFSSSGTFILQIGQALNQNKGKSKTKEGNSEIQFNKPTGLAIDSQGYLYVADRNNDRVAIFNSFGNFIREIRDGSASLTTSFNKPHGLAIDKEGNLFVADRNNDRIRKYDSNGNLLMEVNTGVGFDNLNKPQGVIALDSRGKIYASDRNNDRVLTFSSSGTFLSVLGSSGTLSGKFNKPDGIWVNSLGYIYVADSNNDRIQKFDPYGNPVMSFGGSSTSLTTSFNKPGGITLDKEGNLYVVDSNNGRIQVFGLPAHSTTTVVSAALSLDNPTLPTDFKLGEYYSFPNPAKNGKNPAIHFECGIADKVEIKIYDVAGDLIHQQELPGHSWQVVDGKYCYEYTWDVSDIASGVYIYCIQAKKSGYPDIKVRKKLAVIR